MTIIVDNKVKIFITDKIDILKKKIKEWILVAKECSSLVWYEVCEESNTLYILMDYSHGNLQKYVEIKKNLDEKDIIHVMFDIGHALDHLEKKGIVNECVKMENIFVMEDATFKLGNFIIENILGLHTQSAEAQGEIFTNEKPSSSLYMYDLGVIIYMLMSGGKLPYKINSNNIISTPCLSPLLKLQTSAYSEELKNLVYRMVNLNPSDRPSFQEMIGFSLKQKNELNKKFNKVKKQNCEWSKVNELKKNSNNVKKEDDKKMIIKSDELKNKNSDIKKENDKIKEENDELRKINNNVKKENDEIKKENNELKKTVRDVKKEYDEMKIKNNELEREITELKKKNNEVTKEIDEENFGTLEEQNKVSLGKKDLTHIHNLVRAFASLLTDNEIQIDDDIISTILLLIIRDDDIRNDLFISLNHICFVASSEKKNIIIKVGIFDVFQELERSSSIDYILLSYIYYCINEVVRKNKEGVSALLDSSLISILLERLRSTTLLISSLSIPEEKEEVMNIQKYISECLMTCTSFSYEQCYKLVKFSVISLLLYVLERYVLVLKSEVKKLDKLMIQNASASLFNISQKN